MPEGGDVADQLLEQPCTGDRGKAGEQWEAKTTPLRKADFKPWQQGKKAWAGVRKNQELQGKNTFK